MSWKKWKTGLLVAAITSAGTAYIANILVPTMSLVILVKLMTACGIKDALLYLKDHPVDRIGDGSGEPPKGGTTYGGGLAVLLAMGLFFVVSGTGCSSAAKYAKALSGDQAIVTIRLGTPWGTESLTRVGGTTNSVTVNPDGSIVINPPAAVK